ncbi:cysteine synthase A [Blochmannia endosymbiont of Polyrhachis (Hedomyrma) turneri]|uniref:cysteine synthase A n=1 Tax=Blochmannia endosymbiont of Polyrhachis (Hedomyrma) turneri TaxID=1505596 RepID=UPI00061A7783|nr:cysteine synthase A [Blochmannia endosymbiont of Polyrhachis (Hedomyrma) turneri]AKC60068.1 cysteine synthase A [Blochmannia endosymbiont of Polyrhachis (Hedomyrma) turneri]
MNKIYTDNSMTIGNTPLVRLNHIGNGYILAKIESRNPSFSVKCRIGANMIWDAEKRNILQKNTQIIEATSGNTGIALAFVAAARQYKLTLTMPDTMSQERQILLKALGANLILTDGRLGMTGAINKAQDMIEKNKNYLMLKQFSNPANPKIHEQSTGPEIWKDTNGDIDIFIAGVGTGGTITGVGRYFKHIQKKHITIVAVEPKNSPVITQTLNGEKLQPGPHKIQGIGAGFIPENLDLTLIDKVLTVTNEQAFLTAKTLMKKEGIISGISSGAVIAAALELQKNKNYNNKKIVAILPSSGERYLSTALFSERITHNKTHTL